MALTGNIGRPGCGPHSQTGQPNAMGERLTGGLTGRLPFNIGLDNPKHRAFCAETMGHPQGASTRSPACRTPAWLSA